MADTPSEILDASGFILAGGESNRFGEDKALFTVNGEPLIQRPIACLMGLVSSVAIIVKDPERYNSLGIPVVEDRCSQKMPHVGVLTGLETAESPWSVFLACDMPSITPGVIRTLYEARRTDDSESVQAVVPETPSGVHPLAGVYHESSADALRRAIENGWSMRGWLSELSTRVVSFEVEEPFRNVNHKDDLPEGAGES